MANVFRYNNSLHTRVTALGIGFVMNVIGNSLTIASNMGAEPWAAAAQNLFELTGYSVGIFLFVFGVGNALLNQALLKTIDKSRFVGEIMYIACFSYFVDLFLDIFKIIDVQDWNTILRGFLSCLGVALFCLGISLYQRANILMHPNDDTSNIIRFKFLHGSAILSQIVDILPALAIIGFCWMKLKTVYSINIGTIFSLVCNGIIIKESDEQVWPKLRHNHHKPHKLSEWFDSMS